MQIETKFESDEVICPAQTNKGGKSSNTAIVKLLHFPFPHKLKHAEAEQAEKAKLLADIIMTAQAEKAKLQADLTAQAEKTKLQSLFRYYEYKPDKSRIELEGTNVPFEVGTNGKIIYRTHNGNVSEFRRGGRYKVELKDNPDVTHEFTVADV